MMKFASGEEAVRESSEMRLTTDPKISNTLSHVPGDRTQTSVNTDRPSSYFLYLLYHPYLLSMHKKG